MRCIIMQHQRCQSNVKPALFMPFKTSLASSSASPRARAAATGKSAPATPPNRRKQPQGDKFPPSTGGTPAPNSRGLRTSVNVYGSDLDCLEPLRVFLRKQTGLRVIKDSTLIQVLCRTCQPSPAHVAALQAVQQTTSRRYRS